MQKQLLLILAVSCSFLHLRAGDHPISSLSGTYLVGSSQPFYKKLTNVAAMLNNVGMTVTGDVVFELDSDYDGTTGETFPITINQFNNSGNWTVTIRPKAGIPLRTTAGDPGTQPLITFNGTDRLIFDGRAGGAGGIAWLIRNTATTNAGATFFLKNDAQNNTLTWLQLEGQAAGDGVGVVCLGATTGNEGNDNNTISYCTIRDRTDIPNPVMPAIGIFSADAIATGGTIIDHNHIFNFFNNADSAYGIRLKQGADNSSVTNNSIYMERMLSGVSGNTYLFGIAAGDMLTVNLTIKDNFIGGAAPECGGHPFTVSGGGTVAGIRIGVYNSFGLGPVVCSGNTVRNLNITISELGFNAFHVFTGIRVDGLKTDVTDNTIGNPAGHDDVVITSNEAAVPLSPEVSLIYFAAEGGGSVTGNKMGGITVGGVQTSGRMGTLYGIQAGFNNYAPPSFTVSNNTVGSATISDNIRCISASIPMRFIGISMGMPVSISCTNNTVAGVYLGYSGANASSIPMTTGIWISWSPMALVDHNLVSDISSLSSTINQAGGAITPDPEPIFASFQGLLIQATSSIVSNNTIRRLRLTSTALMNGRSVDNSHVCGILLPGSKAEIYNNRIYDLTSANNPGASTSTIVSGIDAQTDNDWGNPTAIYNNLIALDNGTNNNNCEIRGIRFRMPNGAPYLTLYHNSIYIGGNAGIASNGAISAVMTWSKVKSTASSVANLIHRNNLLVNERTGGAGAHYIFRDVLNTPGTGWTTATSDMNVLITGNVNKIAVRGTADFDTTQWKTKSDAHSWFYGVSQLAPANLFVNPAAGDLGIKRSAGAYVTGKGTASSGITTDITGQLRSTTAPTIGAYEDVAQSTAPVITSYGGNASATLQVPENTTAVATVAAEDDNTLVYSLAGGEDAAKFTVNSATGELGFLAAPDFEQPGDANGDNVYLVTVQASDGDSPVVQRFKIKVTDANDHAPVITSYNSDAAVSLRVPENITGTIATVTATDVDKNTTITYSLVNEEDAAKFTVNPSTGALSFLAVPDYEQPGDNNSDNVYVVTAKASDGDSSATQRFKIKVQDVNDLAPVITSHEGKDVVSLQVAENTTTAVDTVAATDGDAGTVIRYSIVSSEDGALFTVDPVTGVLRFITPPDYEQPADGNHDNSYIVTVQASDGNFTATQRFGVKVTNINDSPLIITSTTQVPENTLVVTTLGATDADAGVTIGIEPEGDGALFSFDPATGILSFIAPPDFEHPADANGDNVYAVAIRMFDGALPTILKLNISVTDTDGPDARMTGRNTPEPQVQSTVVLQMEAVPGAKPKAIRVYPNPVTGKRFNLRLDSIAAGPYTLELCTTGGQFVCRQRLSHTGKSALYPVQLPASLAPGAYVLKLEGSSFRHTETLVVE
ncbi:MAG: cadherin repeat domain-containing protein [Chitinophagaceae bacterium]